MDSRFRYEVSHVVMNCINPQESLRALRAPGACREHGEAGETSTCCCMYVPFRLYKPCPLNFGSNLQQATLSTAFTQSNRSCPRCGVAILVTDFFQGVTISSPIVQMNPQVADLGSAYKLAPQSPGLPQTERLSIGVLKSILKLREVSSLSMRTIYSFPKRSSDQTYVNKHQQT